MKAVICPHYGPPEVLVIKDIPNPLPKKDEVLVKINASSLNTGDVRIRGLRVEGFMKFVMRIMLTDISSERTEYLEFLRQLFENKNYDAIIDKVYPMEQVVEAHKYVDTGRKKGNVVLKISP